MSNPTKLIRDSALDPDEYRQVTLGTHDYVLVGQPIGWLRQQIGMAVKGLTEEVDPADLDEDTLSNAGFIKMLGDRVYRLLYAFVGEDLMPEWEFNGYPTKERWEQGDYRRDEDPGQVTAKQVRAAIIAGAEVNELDLLKHLGKLLGPELVKGFVTEALLRSMDTALPTFSSPSTPASPSPTATAAPVTASATNSGPTATPTGQ